MEIDPHLMCIICIHVFLGQRPVRLAVKDKNEWCLLCGEMHADLPDSYRVVGIGHELAKDPTISEILDLPSGWQAERPGVGQVWKRSLIPSEESN